MSDRNVRLVIQATSELPEVATQLEKLIQLEGKLLEAVNQANLSARTGSMQQIEALNSVSAALEKQRTARGRANDEATKANKDLEKQMADITSNLKSFTGMVASAFAVTEIKSFGEGVIEAKTKIDAIHLSLETMLGSKKEADELYTKVVALAKETPFSLEEIGNQVVKLKAYNIETSDLIPTITALGNIAAAVGKEKLPQLTLAYGQVATTGKLMGDELNQFREVGLPVLDLIGKSYGKTSSEVQKMAADHTISFAMVRKAILDASADGGRYQDLMVKLSRTVGGEVSNLSDAFEVAKAKIGDFFEDQISGGTARLKGLIETLIGSNSAIQRTVTTIEAVAAGYTTWKVAMSSAAAQQLIVNAATKATEVVMGTYNLTMISLKGTTEGFTRAQQESAVASRTMWSTLSANPIGAVLTLVGLVTTAYMAWKAATTEVTNELGENELKLKDEQAQINTLVESAMDELNTRKQRKEAIELLIQKFPQYFSGLNSEKTSNSQLKDILDKVNGSYQKRIDLARQAYNLDAIAEKRKELFQFEKDFFESLPTDIGDKFNGSIVKFNQALNSGTATAAKLKAQLNDFAPGGAAFFGGVAQNATEKFKVVEDTYNKTTKNIQQIESESAKALIDAENTRWKNQQANLDKGSKSYQAAEQTHLDNLAKLNGTYREKELTNLSTFEEKKKNFVLISDREMALIKKANDADNQVDRLKELQDELDYLNKKEDQELEAVRKRLLNKNISDKQLAALKEQARKQADAIDAKFDAERKVIEDKIEAEKQARFLVSAQEIADKSQVLIKQRMEAERVLTLLNDAKTNEQRVAALREYNEKLELGLKDQATKELKIQLDASKKALDDLVAKNGERGDEYRKAYERWLRDNQQYNAALTTQTITAAKETAQQIKEYEKQIQEAKQETARLDQETLQVQAKSRKEIIGLTLDLLSQQSGIIGQASSAIKAVMSNIDALSSKAVQAAQDGVANANIYLNNIKTTYEEGTAQGDAAIAHANERLADANNTAAKTKAAADTAFLGIVSTGVQVILALAAAIQEQQAAAYKAAAESVGKLRDVNKEMYESMAQASRDSYQQQMEAAKGNTEQQLAIVKSFYEEQDKFASSSVRIDAELAYHQKFLELRGEQKKMLLWWEQDKQDALYQDQARAAQEALLIQASITGLERQKEKYLEVYNIKLAAIDDELSHRKQALQDEIDANKSALDQQIADLNTALTEKKALLEQASSDDQLRLQADSVYRGELLAAGEIREVKFLEDAKKREVKRAEESGKSAEEVARIINAFNELIALKHKEYEDAKGDKSKEIQLAIKEVTAQTSDSIKAKEEETQTAIKKANTDSKDAITILQNQIRMQEIQAARDKAVANTQYAQAVWEVNAQIWDQTRQLKTLELTAEIAKLESQKSWTGIGNGAIDSAINTVRGLISQIQNMGYNVARPTGTDGIIVPDSNNNQQIVNSNDTLRYYVDMNKLGNRVGGPGKPIREDNLALLSEGQDVGLYKGGNRVELTYDPGGKRVELTDSSGKVVWVAFTHGRSLDKDGNVVESFFHGTNFVDGTGYPNGKDTVPAMVNKGERIVPTVMNEILGGKRLSNEQLVDNVVGFERFKQAFPEIARGMTAYTDSGFNKSMMKLPDSIMKGNSNMEIGKLHSEMKALRSDMRNLKQLHITMDEHGFTKSIISRQAKITYMQSFFQR